MRRRLARTLVPLLTLPVAVTGLSQAAQPAADERAILSFETRTQVPTAQRVESLGAQIVWRFDAIPAVAVVAPAGTIDAVARSLGASEVEMDRPLQYMMETATKATNAIDVWNTAWRTDVPLRKPMLTVDGDVIDGKGVVVGVVDSGIDALHPDLWYAPAWIPGMPMPPKVLACMNVQPPSRLTFDGQEVASTPSGVGSQPYCDETVGHGTHVAGIVAGNAFAARNGYTTQRGNAKPFVGAAPGAQLVGAGLGAGLNLVNTGAALDWMYANREVYGIRVVTNSWGDAPDCVAGGFTLNSTDRIVNQLVEDGVTVLFAAGNYSGGATWTSTFSRNLTPGVISVANYSDEQVGSRAGKISSGSSDGCTASTGGQNRVWTWPDVAAPGSGITSTAPITGAVIAPLDVPPFYGSASGTSMATPHVAGIVALMLQANPDLTPAQVERILIDTATPWTDDVTSRSIVGSVPMWGASNTAARSWVDRGECFVAPSDVTDPDGAGSDLLLIDALPDPDRFVCRDYRRGNGLVDAYAAVRAALELAD